MIIQCPRCSTRWRVAEPAATENPVFKCGRCHNVFQRFPGAAAVSERARHGRQRAAGPPEPDTLEFIFPRRPSAEEAPPDDVPAISPLREIVSDPPAPAGLDAPAGRYAAAAPRDAVDAPTASPPHHAEASGVAEDDTRALDDVSFDGSVPDDAALADDDLVDRDLAHSLDADAPLLGDDELDVSSPDDGAPTELGDVDGSDESRDESSERERAMRRAAPALAARVLHVEDVMRGGSVFGFGAIARALVILVAAHALLALLVRANPGPSADMLVRVPLLGTRLADEPALGRDILLRNVQGGYQRLKNARLVFVISGEAVNNSMATVERIQVEGALYGAGGEVDRKVISTGNETTLKLSDLSEPEIALLQRFEPHATLAPGASIPYAIVFLEPPAKLREFSSRVLTARPTARAANPPANRALGPASVG